jgi:hypothetical protein
MSIKKVAFTNESELHGWVEKNVKRFFGDAIYLKGFRINTKRNKFGIPDGFVLDLENNSWTIIESELIKHGVWDHIAEQIVRFIVAIRSSDTKRKIRNQFFDEIEKRDLIKEYAKKLNLKEHRLIQNIENLIETTTPDIAIFIDDVNEDLEDMAEAVNATISIFKIQKYSVNGKIEYQSPEGNKSVFETTVEDVKDSRGNFAAALDAMGGGKPLPSVNRIKIFQLKDGDSIAMKYSKYYENDQSYWYGITPNTLRIYQENKLSHLAFVLGNEGVVKIPFSTLMEYLQTAANVTKKQDGSIDHYHVFIRGGQNPSLFTSKNKKHWNIEKHYVAFD